MREELTMKPVITFANQKGGVGKTTSAAAVIDGFRRRGYKVLGIDCDAQANLTKVQGEWVPDGQPDTVDFIKGRPARRTADGQATIPADYEDLVTIADSTMPDGSPILATMLGERVGEALADGFDLAVIDTHPDASFLALASLMASTHVIIPAEPEVFAVEGISQELDVMDCVTTETGMDWEGRTGVLITKVDRRRNLHRTISEDISSAFSDGTVKVFGTSIRLTASVSDSQARGKSIYEGQSVYHGAVSNYDWLVDEIEAWVGLERPEAGAQGL